MAGKVISLSKAIELGIIGRHNPNEDSSSSEEEGEQAATNPYRPYFPFQHRHPNTAAGLYHQTAAGAAAADGERGHKMALLPYLGVMKGRDTIPLDVLMLKTSSTPDSVFVVFLGRRQREQRKKGGEGDRNTF